MAASVVWDGSESLVAGSGVGGSWGEGLLTSLLFLAASFVPPTASYLWNV